MENHPIPQDVTGFKFKLIGSVTIKQFLYLLGFGILTTVSFVLQVNLFIKIPLMLIFSSIGLGLAFVPIEGRPMDIMLMNFAKTIPSENRYIFRKRGVNLFAFEFFKPIKAQAQATLAQTQEATNPNDQKRAILLSRLRNSSFRADDSEVKFFNNIKTFFEESPVPKTTVFKTTAPLPETTPQEPSPKQNIAFSSQTLSEAHDDKVQVLKKQIEEAKKIQVEKPQGDLSQKIRELEEDLQKALLEKDALAKKIVDYEVEKTKKVETIFTPSKQEKMETENVKFVSPGQTLKAGFPTLPDVPNIVLGIIRDPRGKTLPNILVEVLDLNNIPVRAFKTGALGQFAAATPLPNGIYKIYFEDPAKHHEFEIIEINLNGEIFNPLEIISVDSREKLRRELFGGNVATG